MSHSESRPTLTVNGVHELTRVWEPESSPPRCDVLIVHGINEHSGRYEHVGDQMSTAGFRVESFDLVGWGASGGARGDISDWTVYLDQVQGHLEPLLSNQRPTVLYGHSMGGLIVAEYMRRRTSETRSRRSVRSGARGGRCLAASGLAKMLGARCWAG